MSILILLALPNFFFGQELVPFESNNFWGYKDTLDNIVIKAEYQYAKQFQGEYAVVAQNDKLGVIDKFNHPIILPNYEYIRDIGWGMFLYGNRAKYFGEYNLGIITAENEILIPPEYYNITYKNGYFIVHKQSYEVLNRVGIYDHRRAINQYGIIDSQGKIILEPIFSNIEFLSNGAVKIAKELNGDFALFDESFNQLTEYKYMVIGGFYDGLAKVRDKNCYGYINVEGKEEIECKYELNNIFIDSLAIARNNGKWGMINRNDELILDFKYHELRISFEGQVAVSDSIKWGMINLQGDTLLAFDYEKLLSEFKGITAFSHGGKWKVWDYEKRKLFSAEYDEIELVEGDESTVLGFGRIKRKEYSLSIALVRDEDKWGVVSSKGQVLVPLEFQKKDLSKKMKEMWDTRYRSDTYAYGMEPNEFLKESLNKYRLTGKVLFPAEGEGRNAVYAAKLGLDVTAFDISEEGKNKALQLATLQKVQIDFKVGDFLTMGFVEQSFDGAALIFAHFPPNILSDYHKKIASLIKPNGLIILEGFSENNLPYRERNPKIGGPDKKEMLFSKESIQQDFSGFEILELEEKEIELNEGIYHNGIGKVIRFVGRKVN